MHIRSIDLNLLTAFDALMRERSVSRAADALGMSQSGLSHALARLRDLVGDPLFIREQRQLVPTLRAMQLAPVIAGALQTVQSALTRDARFDPSTDRSQFRLMMPDLGEILVLPSLMARLETDAPEMLVAMQQGFGRGYVRDIVAGRIHFSLELQPATATGIESVPWFRDDLVAVCAKGAFPNQTSLSVDDYANARHVLYAAPGLSEPPMELILKSLGIHRQHQMQTATVLGLVFIAGTTTQIATLPRRFAEQLCAHGNTKILALPFIEAGLDCHLWWPQVLGANPAHIWLRETLLTLLP